jgi:hypothetical protein
MSLDECPGCGRKGNFGGGLCPTCLTGGWSASSDGSISYTQKADSSVQTVQPDLSPQPKRHVRKRSEQLPRKVNASKRAKSKRYPQNSIVNAASKALTVVSAEELSPNEQIKALELATRWLKDIER